MRILAIDLGSKRTGLAVTDPLQIIASPLETVPTHTLLAWLRAYTAREQVEAIVVGMPRRENGQDSDMSAPARRLIAQLQKAFPQMAIHAEDERYTTRMAHQAILQSGIGRQARQDKGLADKVSASIILQSHLEGRQYASRSV